MEDEIYYNDYDTLVFTEKGLEIIQEEVQEPEEEPESQEDWISRHDDELYSLYKDLKESLQYFQKLSYNDLCWFIATEVFSGEKKEPDDPYRLCRSEYELVSYWRYINMYHPWTELKSFSNFKTFVHNFSSL